MTDDSAKGKMLATKAVDDLDVESGPFPLAPVGLRQDSITQAHVGKGELAVLRCLHDQHAVS